jgi:hypothetical protein
LIEQLVVVDRELFLVHRGGLLVDLGRDNWFVYTC